ncbi:MAG: efflux RND transporter periplasmic adaptor subunit [Dehalococcoidia bacterium]
MKVRIITIIVTGLALTSMLLSGCSKSTAPAAGTVYNIKKGEFDITVESDGYVNTPNTYNLAFNTNGIITQILVDEGDVVHAGAMLAFLDDTSEINGVENALYNLQNTVNTQNAPNGTINCNVVVPYSYPDMSSQVIFEEAQKDMDLCLAYYQQADYKDAGYQLAQVYFDIDVCADLISSRINSQQYAGMPTTSPYFGPDNLSPVNTTAANDKKVIDYLKQYQQRLLNVSALFMHGQYSDLDSELPAAQQEMLTGYALVKSTVYLHDKAAFTYTDTPTSRDFLLAAETRLDEMDKYLADNGTDPVAITKKLFTAQESLSIGSDMLNNQKLFFSFDGFNWKTLQTYNLQLQANEIALQQAKQQIMNTVIIAPANGTITAKNLTVASVLSTIDFASRPALQLVDTGTIEFDGLIDEIDILDIFKGQHADITVDAVPNKVYSGTITFISPYSDATSTTVVKFDVKILLDAPAPELKGGMSATALIKTYTNPNAVLLPVSAIAYTSAKQPYVALVDNVTGVPVYREVTLGHQNFQYAEALSGLQDGDKVLPASANAVKPPIAPTRAGGGGLPGLGGGLRAPGGGGRGGGGGGGGGR